MPHDDHSHKRPKHKQAFLIDRKKRAGDDENLIMALAALVERTGEVNITDAELEAINGKRGLRGRYEPDGSFTLWTYDLLDDIRRVIQ